MQSKLEKLPQSRIRLTVTVPAETIIKHYQMAVTKVSQQLEIPGFRKGHAPEKLIVERAGNGTILNEMFDTIIPETYYLAIQEEKEIIPVEQPKVDVKELKGIDEGATVPTEMVYVAEVDIMPEVQLGDYKKIKVKPKKASETIDNKELDKTMDELKKIYGDDYLKIGNFSDEAAMRQAVTENLKQQKVIEAKSSTYDEIIEAVLKKVKLEVPEAFIHNEIHRMEEQIAMQAKTYGMTFDDWLAQEKKTHEDIHKEFRPQAEKAAKVGMVLGKIAEEEGIDPTKNDASRLVLAKLYEYATGEKPTEDETENQLV